jgi:hypothetical protein
VRIKPPLLKGFKLNVKKTLLRSSKKRKAEERQRAEEAARREQVIQSNFKPEITVLKEGVIISNAGKEKWESVNVFVNSEPPFGYGCRLDNMKPLESKPVPLSEFVNSDGKRFDPNAYKVLYVWIGNDQVKYRKYGF